jgi:hypothetical protein
MRSTFVLCVILVASCRSTENAPLETIADRLEQRTRDQLGTGDPSYGRDPGTELAKHVDVARALPASARTPPGVLRLELAEIAPGHVIVRHPTSPRGFVISRNENGALIAHQKIALERG